MGELLGVELKEDPKLISPAKAEKKGMPKDLVSACVERVPLAFKLVQDNNNKAKEIFK